MHGSISMNTIVKKRQGNRLRQITSLPYIPKLKRKQKQRCKAISFKIKPAKPTKLRLRAQFPRPMDFHAKELIYFHLSRANNSPKSIIC